MVADRKWVERNLGFDPLSLPAQGPRRRPAQSQRARCDLDYRRRPPAQPRPHANLTGPEDLAALPARQSGLARTGPAESAVNPSSTSSPIRISQDGPKLPNQKVWTQIIQETSPKLVITTSTAGGVGSQFEVGDVVVSPLVKFDCQKTFKQLNDLQFSSSAPRTEFFALAKTLFKANAGQPKDNTRPPAVTTVALDQLTSGVLTTDFFGFDLEQLLQARGRG